MVKKMPIESRGDQLLAACLLIALAAAGSTCRRSDKSGAAGERSAGSVQAAREREQRQSPIADVAPAPTPAELPLSGEAGVGADGYPTRYVDQPALRRLLRDARYSDLNRYIEQFQAEFESNPRSEYWPIDASDAFSVSDAQLVTALDVWAGSTPESFAPYLARGAYWTAIGYARRGARWASETHEDNFAGMEDAFRHASSDLEHALKIRPKLVAAMRQQIMLLSASAGKDEQSKVVTEALRVCPECFQIRVTQIVNLAPRWGGSYEAMLAFAQNAPVSANPRFRLLRGYVDYDKARVLLPDDPAGALNAIQRACALGDHWEFLLERASIANKLGNSDLAIRDLDRADELRPQRADVLAERAYVRLTRKEYELAGDDLLAALRANPTSSDARGVFKSVVQGLVYRGWEFAQAGRKDDAFRVFELAVELDPTNSDAQARRSALVSGR